MAAPQPPTQPTGKSLFSQHYLATRLPEQPEWQEDSAAPLAALYTLWQKAQRYGANWNEAQTEDEFIGSAPIDGDAAVVDPVGRRRPCLYDDRGAAVASAQKGWRTSIDK